MKLLRFLKVGANPNEVQKQFSTESDFTDDDDTGQTKMIRLRYTGRGMHWQGGESRKKDHDSEVEMVIGSTTARIRNKKHHDASGY